MEEPPHAVGITAVVLSWMLTILLGSLLIPIALLTFEPAYTDPGMFVVTFGLFFVFGLVISVPSLLVHMVVCSLMNSRFSLQKYVLLQNVFHIVHAIVVFAVIDLVSGGEVAKMEVSLPGCCYTFAGLLVWNVRFLVRARQISNSHNVV